MFFLLLDIPSIYSKILGETNFHAREIPQRGWKAEGVGKRKKKVGENNGLLRFRPPLREAHASRLDQLILFLSLFHSD